MTGVFSKGSVGIHVTGGISHSDLGNYVAKVSTPILQMKRLRHDIIKRFFPKGTFEIRDSLIML